MRITFNTQSTTTSILQTAAEQLAKAQREVTSGRRINTASDDPLGARTVVQEKSEMSTLDAFSRSADTASSRLSAADTALSAIIDLYTQAQSTATAARGSTATQGSRDALAAQITGIRDSILNQVNAQFAGRPLFAGSATSGSAYSGTADNWTYGGTSDVTQLEVQRGRLVSVTFDGQSILQGADPQNILNGLDALATAISAGDDAGIKTGLDNLDAAMARATRAQGNLGADENAASSASQQLTSLRLASDTRRSKAEDTNLADAMTRLSAADTSYRAALSAISREERLTLLDYLK